MLEWERFPGIPRENVRRASRRIPRIQQLIEKIKKTKAPICVGLDPMLNYIPEHILKKSYNEFS